MNVLIYDRSKRVSLKTYESIRVKDLIEILQMLNQDKEILMITDEGSFQITGRIYYNTDTDDYGVE